MQPKSCILIRIIHIASRSHALGISLQVFMMFQKCCFSPGWRPEEHNTHNQRLGLMIDAGLSQYRFDSDQVFPTTPSSFSGAKRWHRFPRQSLGDPEAEAKQQQEGVRAGVCPCQLPLGSGMQLRPRTGTVWYLGRARRAIFLIILRF